VSELRLRRSSLQWLEADGEIVALDEQALVYLSANESGAVLWQALAAGTTRDGLADALAERFGLDRDQAGRDVDAFVAELERRDLLEP
jgi:hypothetical protein